jgi:hypothetical protein
MKSLTKHKRELLKVDSRNGKVLLVGDNPFHNISHLSQERSRARGGTVSCPERAAGLVLASLDHGANGFMFSVSETTLSILRTIRKAGKIENLELYAIVPYAYEYVRLATQVGGVSGVAKSFAKQLILSGNIRTLILALRGFIKTDLEALMKAYLTYELSRIKSSGSKQANVRSLLLHQVITDMALALDLKRLFKSYVDFMLKKGVTPGFNTGNFAYLVNKFAEWDMDLAKISIAAPFNKVGFQMNPSREECERALKSFHEPAVIAISILAAGYLRLPEAIDYVAALPNIKGVAVGVSKEKHARETFRLIRDRLGDGR